MNICNGYDNVGKNYFFLKRDATSKFEILVWDLDATWGRDSEGGTRPSNERISNFLFEKLIRLNPNNYIQNLKNRWTTLRTNTLSQSNLTGLFNSNFTKLTDYKSISDENLIWNSSVNLATEQSYINNWLANRLTYLDSYFSNL